MKLPIAITFLLHVLLLPGFTHADEKQYVKLDESDKEGDFEILIIGSFGQPMSEHSIVVARRVNKEWREVHRGKTSMRLKYGTYKLRVEDVGFDPVDRVFEVQSPLQVAIVALFPARWGIWDWNTIRGRLTELSGRDECRWIRLVSPFGDGPPAESKIVETGHFVFDNVRPGTYIAVTMGNQGICGTSQVTITGERFQDITVGEPGTGQKGTDTLIP